MAESRNIELDSVIARQREDYEKYDFKFAYRNLRYAGSSSIIGTSTKPSKYMPLDRIYRVSILEIW